MSGVRCVPPSLMPAKSKAQQRLMGLAYGNPEVRKQIGIKKKDARKLAKTKHAGLPDRKHPLRELFELFDAMNVVDQPPLEQEMPSSVEGPNQGEYEHPVIQQRKEVDELRANGMSDTDAHQQVYGEIRLDDSDSKSKMAATLARIQTDDNKRGIQVDKDPNFQSLLAREKAAQEVNQVTPDDLRTPKNQEIPDELENQQEDWYNFDVSYLQKYGRA